MDLMNASPGVTLGAGCARAGQGAGTAPPTGSLPRPGVMAGPRAARRARADLRRRAACEPPSARAAGSDAGRAQVPAPLPARAAARCGASPCRGHQGPGGALRERAKRWARRGAGTAPCCPFGFSAPSGVMSPPSFSLPHRAGGVVGGEWGDACPEPGRGQTGLLSLAPWILSVVAFWPCGTFYALPGASAVGHYTGSPCVAVGTACPRSPSAVGPRGSPRSELWR